MSRKANRAKVAQAKLYGSLQRAIALWRVGDIDALTEQRVAVRNRWDGLIEVGGQPDEVVDAVWAREVNADIAGRVEPIEVLGRSFSQ